MNDSCIPWLVILDNILSKSHPGLLAGVFLGLF